MICILTRNMLPEYYEFRHWAQQIGFEGPDLAEKHRRMVSASAKTISVDSITCVNDTQFRVASQSNLDRCYLVDIQQLICNCPDFPRVQLCKHLCAVKIWYPHIPPLDDFHQDLQRLSPISSQIAATPAYLSGELPHHTSNSDSTSSRALPNRDRLSPNQNQWAATAKRIGVRSPPKRRQRCHDPGASARLPSRAVAYEYPVTCW